MPPLPRDDYEEKCSLAEVVSQKGRTTPEGKELFGKPDSE
jgi:hypothetical protein